MHGNTCIIVKGTKQSGKLIIKILWQLKDFPPQLRTALHDALDQYLAMQLVSSTCMTIRLSGILLCSSSLGPRLSSVHIAVYTLIGLGNSMIAIHCSDSWSTIMIMTVLFYYHDSKHDYLNEFLQIIGCTSATMFSLLEH